MLENVKQGYLEIGGEGEVRRPSKGNVSEQRDRQKSERNLQNRAFSAAKKMEKSPKKKKIECSFAFL